MRYRNAILTRAPMGHVNVTRASDGGFCGGFKTMAEAKRWVDGQNQHVERLDGKDDDGPA